MLLLSSFPRFFHNCLYNVFSMQVYWFSFSLPTGIMDLGAADLILEEIPQTSTECLFLKINVALPLTSAVSFDTAPYIVTKTLIRASLKSPHSPKVQKEQFKSEQHTKSFLTGMPSTFPYAHTYLYISSSWLVLQVCHWHQHGAQLVHHHYPLKEGFQV